MFLSPIPVSPPRIVINAGKIQSTISNWTKIRHLEVHGLRQVKVPWGTRGRQPSKPRAVGAMNSLAVHFDSPSTYLQAALYEYE
jgi:3-methyladenine DNA glycosylase Tag